MKPALRQIRSVNDPTAITRMNRGFLFLLGVSIVGVVGYLITGWSLLDAIYMVVITIFGVGYGEVHNIDAPGLKVFTICLIISGCSALIYILGGFFQLIAEGELNRALGKIRMTKQINELNNHVIVCGFGRIGRVLTADLKAADVEVVVVDPEEDRLLRAAAAGALTYKGDATHDETLRRAGVDRAKALCTVLPNDALNVFITLTARNLNPEVQIIARGEDPETEPKLRQAGANRVVLPSAISASQMADMLTRPKALDYLQQSELRDLDEDLKSMGITLRSIELGQDAAGHTVGDIEHRAKVSMMVTALIRKDGHVVERPELDVELQPGDSVVLLAHERDASRLAVSFSKPAREVTYRGATVRT